MGKHYDEKFKYMVLDDYKKGIHGGKARIY